MGSNSSVKFLSIFCAIFAIARIIKFVPVIPTPIYYGVWGLILFYILLHKIDHVNLAMVAFCVICFLSIVSNRINPEYNIWLRYIGFLIIVLTVGPILTSKFILQLRYQLFNAITISIITVTVISLIIYFINPQLMLTERGNLYGGLTIHSMQMGPIAGISSCYILSHLLYNVRCRRKFKARILYVVCIIISALSCVLAGSRSAILAMLVSFIICIWLYYKNNIKQFFLICIVLLSIIFASSPLWWEYTETVQMKMEISQDTGDGIMSSRVSAWNERINEFYDSPILGCGFATVKSDYSYRGDGLVEPGNGWLFILSSTGIITFLIFISLYFYIIFKLLKRYNYFSITIIILLIFMGIHLNAEGYSLSSGNFPFLYFWLLLGLGYSYIKTSKL